MAPFNKRQIGYIKAIANVDAHNSYVQNIVGNGVNLPITTSFAAASDASMKQKFWTLGKVPLTYGVGATPTEAVDTTKTPIDVYNVPLYVATPDDRNATKQQRITAECFLESVNLKMRMIQALDVSTDTKSHQEYRMCVFRHKERQSHIKQLAQNFSDPAYDMFVTNDGFKFGPKGIRTEVDDAGSGGSLTYSAHTGYFAPCDAQTMMTCHTNRTDYVFMKDCRFYLGKEYGGKHIFETKLHFEHQDPIATDLDDISTTDNDKNYVWYIWIGVVTNAGGTTASVSPDFPYTRFDTTTHVTSG